MYKSRNHSNTIIPICTEGTRVNFYVVGKGCLAIPYTSTEITVIQLSPCGSMEIAAITLVMQKFPCGSMEIKVISLMRQKFPCGQFGLTPVGLQRTTAL